MPTRTSVGSGNWSTAGTWDSPPTDGDAVVIAAGHSVLMDADLSAWTGLTTLTITGHSTTPGMLYFKDGTNGYLKFRTGTGNGIVGTNTTVFGRLLANSDGVWGNTGALAFANKAVIDLVTAARIQARYLDIALYCYQPTTKFLRTYNAKVNFDASTGVDTGTDVITFASAPPSAGTAVRILPISGATLPTGLNEYDLYYTRSVSGSTCKLAYRNDDTSIVDITAAGSGTCCIVTGVATSTSTINVVEDVSAETGWTATDGHDRIVLVDYGPAANDVQRVAMTTINAGSIVTTATDSAQYPGARIYLSSRNVSIRNNNTSSVNIVDYNVGTHAGVFQCEIVGTATTPAATGIYGGGSHTISGTITGCSVGISTVGGASTVSGNIIGNPTAATGLNATWSGHIGGGTYGLNTCYGTMSGLILGCNSGLYTCVDTLTVSGVIAGCQYGTNLCTLIGSSTACIQACQYGLYYTGDRFAGRISGASSYAVDCVYQPFLSGTIEGCGTAIGTNQVGNVVMSNLILKNNTIALPASMVRFVGSNVTLTGNGTDGGASSQNLPNIIWQYGGTANAHAAWIYSSATITHETGTVPSGKAYSHKWTHLSATYLAWIDYPIIRTSKNAVSIDVQVKHSATSLTASQRMTVALVDLSSDPFVDATKSYLDTFAAADSTDWQTDTLAYERADDRPMALRFYCQRGSGNTYIWFEPTAVGAGGAGGGVIIGNPIVRAI